MKLLFLHVDYIEWQGLKKALKKMEDLSPKELEKQRVEEALGVLIAVEKGDSENSVKKLVDEIKDVAGQVKAENIVLYPYAHLSNNLGSPEIAVRILKDAEKELKKNFDVKRAPFGYYKSFEMKVKGHPLSELSREIVIGGYEEILDISDEDRKKVLKEISKSKLDTSKLKDNDHRIIGRKMDLWSFNEVAPGMVFWHDKGLHIKNKLIEFWREIHRKDSYEEISTPQIMDRKLWEISGHWSKYGENNFKTNYEGRDFLVKPMNCPGGMLVFKNSPKSYKDLPLRVGEIGVVHRVELSGTLGGLFRVIQFTQDDAHIFCTETQLEEEIKKIIKIINEVFEMFNLEFDHVELSTRPEKRIGDEKLWDFAEKALEEVLKKNKIKYKINEGDGAFYGPKIDFHLKDSLNRTWQCSTIQLDMALPERFEIEYTDEKGNLQRPIMLHRVVFGSVERFIGILTEHLEGKFPLWLSPNQVKIMTMNDDSKDYAREIYDKLFEKGFRVELDDRNESIGKKARDAQIQKFNYLVTVGDKEKENKTLAIRSREDKEVKEMSLEEFGEKISKEIFERK
ncbi:MAG: threonine--tRNA ligase [Candidatus Pacearchaeota archaeon]|nr:threonine--tRNA ligase [Candidatus Pacearchaeota archaeon]